MGEDVTVRVTFYCSPGQNIKVENHCFINLDCIFSDLNTITLGDHVLIGLRASIYTATHPSNPIIRSHDLEYALPVKIGNDVIIGSGSVVIKDIEDNVIIVGNPAHVSRKITEEDHDFWLQQE